MTQLSNGCRLCPRQCGADRSGGTPGYCGVAEPGIYAARAALHIWEEPCISGETGSGAVFFSGCPLRCVYCQNYSIARAQVGKPISVERLAEIFLELQQQKAANINLVTPTHYTPQIIEAVTLARTKGLSIPIVYNCGGYESVETLRSLEGIVDIYLTDFKYMQSEPAERYSRVPIRFCVTCFCGGGRIDRWWAAQISSLASRWACRSAALWWSLRPFWKLTLFTIRWLYRMSVSM